MRLEAGVASDCGLVRPSNEDSFLLRPGLYAVCDGMGGARAGEVASQMACLGLMTLNPTSAEKQDLRQAIVDANQAIVRRSITDDHLLGMGTTLTAVLIREGSLTLAHVGDSRAYLLHEGKLTQLTEDHSWVGEMLRRGELTPDQAAVHPHRSVITRALGTDDDVDPDTYEMPVVEGDRILLCSDGLTGMVSDREIEQLLLEVEDPQETAESLVKAAITGGGEDNVTVVVVDVLAHEQDEEKDGETGGLVDDTILIGPSDRATMVSAASSRRKRAAGAVRERLRRRPAPPVRPVESLQVDGPSPEEETAGDTRAAEGASPSGDPPVPEDEGPTKTSRRRWVPRRWVRWTVALALVIVIAVAGFAVYNSTVYYVGIYQDGTVALYRGLPGSVLGIDLSSVVELGGVEYDVLAPHLQERVDSHDLISKEEGQSFLRTLSAR